MEVPAGQDGIQRLLQAEQEAQAVVANARHAKGERLKQAKLEAEKEVTAYRKQREEDFQRKIATDSTSSQENVTRLAAEADAAVAAIRKSVAAKQEEVLALLLDSVKTVKNGS